MTRFFSLCLLCLTLAVGSLASTGCDVNEGPAEEAGEAVDEAVDEE